MSRGYVVHDEEVSAVMSELAEENMPGVAWVFVPEEKSVPGCGHAVCQWYDWCIEAKPEHVDEFSGFSWVVCSG